MNSVQVTSVMLYFIYYYFIRIEIFSSEILLVRLSNRALATMLPLSRGLEHALKITQIEIQLTDMSVQNHS